MGPSRRTTARRRPVRAATAAALLAAVSAPVIVARPAAAATERITIDSHRSGQGVAVGTVRLSGRYQGVFDLSIVLDAQRTERVRTTPTGYDDSGTWWYDLNTARYDGQVDIAVRGASATTRYPVYSPLRTLRVDNPRANVPVVRITGPADGATTGLSVPIRVAVSARNRVGAVAVRVNGGAWLAATAAGSGYAVTWTAPRLGLPVSIEARAVDAYGNRGSSRTVYVTAGAVPAPAVDPVQLGRAMWLWEDAAYNLVVNGGSRPALAALAADTTTFGSDPVRTVYLGVGRYRDLDMLTDRPAEVRDLLGWAHRRGLRMYALIAGGTDPSFLGGLSRYRDSAVREIEKVLNFNLAAGPGERFDGVNIDIEPYLIGQPFFGTSPALRLGWLDTLRAMLDRRDASRTGLPVGPAIPVWLDLPEHVVTWQGIRKELSAHIQDIADYVALMDYRDTAQRIIADAAGEVDYASAIGKPGTVVIGVETADQLPLSGDPTLVTFHEEGRAAMEGTLTAVAGAFGWRAGYGGIALHHYDSLVDLPSAWGPGGTLPPAIPDASPPTTCSTPLRARAIDHQTVELTFGRAYDNGEVKGYDVYRSTRADVTPGPATLVGRSRGLDFTDTGLLPGTRYHYRVVPVDTAGLHGVPTARVGVTTLAGTQRPVVVSGATIERTGGTLRAAVRVVRRADGTPVAGATVYGWFTRSAGAYLQGRTDADGWVVLAHGPAAASGASGFRVHRILAGAGLYWAAAHDTAPAPEITW